MKTRGNGHSLPLSHYAMIKTLLITAVFQNPTWVPHSMHYKSYILLRYEGIRGRINGILKLLKEYSCVIKDCLKCDREYGGMTSL